MNRLEDYDFDLPEALIALRPAQPRSHARLLVDDGEMRDARVDDLPTFLREGDLLVFNNTRVIPARLNGERFRASAHGSGIARIESTLIERLGPDLWRSLSKPAKRLQLGDTVAFGPLKAKVMAKEGGEVDFAFDKTGPDLDAVIEQIGEMPLPPYIAAKRTADSRDRTDYQTVFARNSGAVAAPTASLHFDANLLKALAQKGVRQTEVTLHVGAGTFLPVKVDNIDTHKMHSEWGEVSDDAARAINETLAAGHRVIPVGTTALRLIETAATGPGRIGPWQGDTDIFIRPGFRFNVTSGLMTNFHLPKSTLLMLVSALMGFHRVRDIYAHAIEQNYRFFSYGDSSLLLP